LSRDLQLNCVINFFFRLHLVLHTCAARFDVADTVALFEFNFRELNSLFVSAHNKRSIISAVLVAGRAVARPTCKNSLGGLF
jgi:hypothetical protein